MKRGLVGVLVTVGIIVLGFLILPFFVQDEFTGTVEKVLDDRVLVDISDEDELNVRYDKVYLMRKDVPEAVFEKGDKISVTYNGTIYQKAITVVDRTYQITVLESGKE